MDVTKFKDLDLSSRILLGPGPSMVPPRVLHALSTPPVGHLDPEFLGVLAEVKELLRFTFQTKNEVTFPLSGTGSAGMEAALCNFIEPGDHVLIAINGYFGARLADMAERYGAQVDRLEHSWGDIFMPDEIRTALKKADYKLFAIVHGETSTGAMQGNVKEIAELVHAYGALLILDTVASLGGIPVKVDEWDVDICYSGSQKCLSAPPGLAPLTVSPRAINVLEERRSPVANWYLDLTLLTRYWGKPHVYHHTVPVNMIFALREALRLVAEEGLEERFARHRANSELLWRGLEDLGMPPLIPLEHRLAPLTTPKLPKGIDEKAIRRRLLTDFNVEIAGGFGPFAGMVWRIGLMGFSSRRENVILLLSLIKDLLPF